MSTKRTAKTKRSKCELVAKPTLRRRSDATTAQIAPNFPKGLARPALRALLSAGVADLKQLSRMREADVAALHGIGPNALERLREALHAAGLCFRR